MNPNTSNLSKYDFKNSLLSNGYEFYSVIRKTLQGQIIIAKQSSRTGNHIVIKMSNKTLCNKGITMINDKEIPIKENITNEKDILKRLTNANPPPYMTNYIDSFDDQENIYLIMQHGGMSAFIFLQIFHKNISKGLLPISVWQETCKTLFRQMITFLAWLHNDMNTCHLDISLENLLVTVSNAETFQIKFCDFGLSETFIGKDFRSNKYVGKRGYKAPEVYDEQDIFDPRAADIWSVGVVLFMLCLGNSPFKTPCKNDDAFCLIMCGQLHKIVIKLNKIDYLTPEIYELLWKIFKKEKDRITIKGILQHPWLE
eukprot:202989_1